MGKLRLPDDLDPGIRSYVETLMKEGVETFESCEGGPGHSFPEPTIRFHGNTYEGYRAFTAAMNWGLPVLNLRRYYYVEDGQLIVPSWEITFRYPANLAELTTTVAERSPAGT
jgi:hypothetical protein